MAQRMLTVLVRFDTVLVRFTAAAKNRECVNRPHVTLSEKIQTKFSSKFVRSKNMKNGK